METAKIHQILNHNHKGKAATTLDSIAEIAANKWRARFAAPRHQPAGAEDFEFMSDLVCELLEAIQDRDNPDRLTEIHFNLAEKF